MKLLVKRIIFCLIIGFGLLGILLFRTPFHTETNLMSLINDNTANAWPVEKISEQFSSVINIIVESKDEKIAKKTAKDIINELKFFDALTVQSNNFSIKELVKDFAAHKNYLLNDSDRQLLANGQFRKIADNAIKQISESMMPSLVSVSDDPFLTLSKFIINLQQPNQSNWKLRDGFLWQNKNNSHYFMISVNTDNTNGANTATQVKLLQKTLLHKQSASIKIHISGVPIHTADMVQKSKIQLGILSVLAILIAMILNYLLFRRIFTLIPVLSSLFVGFLCGTIALFLCFSAPHILTFVFGTSLIGLGIDYAFHFMTLAGLNKKNTVHKNITNSLITTTVCFLPLLFSNISLLQQISVFTIVGLIAIYFGLSLFLPKHLNIEIKPMIRINPVSRKRTVILIATLGIISLIILPFAKFENNMNQIYRADEKILAEDVFFQQLNKSDKSFVLMVRGKTIQQVLETEENIKSNVGDFLSLSSIVPSFSKQMQNYELIKNLYKKESGYLKNKLQLRNLPQFVDTKPITVNSIKSDFINTWLDKLIIKDNDYIYSIAQINSRPAILPDNAYVVSPSQILTQRIAKYTSETYKLLIVCGLCLFGILTLIYRKRAIVYLIPSTLGILMTLAILTVMGQPITFFHLLGFFIVIGLGLDYTIFHINSHDNYEMRPVFYSFLTSFAGFGLLAFTSFFLIKSMGTTLALGLGLSYLISFAVFGAKKQPRRVRK